MASPLSLIGAAVAGLALGPATSRLHATRGRAGSGCVLTATERSREDVLAEKLRAIHGTTSDYLQGKRDELLATVDSHVLIEADNQNMLLPAGIVRDANFPQMVFVDEANCVGCRSCAEVARSTFQMEPAFGVARAFQQCGDEAGVIEEAIDCCPVDCIHTVSFNELKALEQHRQRMTSNGEMAAAQGAGKLAARAEGRSSSASWRDPIRGMRFESNGLEAPRAAVPVAPTGSVVAAARAVDDLEATTAREVSWQAISSLYPQEESME